MNQPICARATFRPAEQIIRRSHMKTRQDRGHYSDHALAALVHAVMLAYSLFIRIGHLDWSHLKTAHVAARSSSL